MKPRAVACMCSCHLRHDDLSYKYGVDVRDFIAAVMACDPCRPNHAAVLDETDPRTPRGDVSTAWADQGDGEGRED